MEKQVIIIETYREDYGLEQIKRTMTVSELIECLQQYDEDAKVFLSFDNGYTYGGIREGMILDDYKELD